MSRKLEFPRKDCRNDFITKAECKLIEENMQFHIDQVRKDIKLFRNQISAILGGGMALATLILALLQYLESLR